MDPQVTAQIRASLIALGGALVGSSLAKYGIDTDAVLPSAVGLIMTLAGAGWSWWTHRDKAVISAAANIPGVVAIVATPEMTSSVGAKPSPLDPTGLDVAPVVTTTQMQTLQGLLRGGK